MALTDYCDYDEIRSALGVNDEELGDAVLALPIYEIGLVRELNRVSTSLPAAFSTASNSATPTGSAKDLIDAVRRFAAYSAAREVGVSLPTLMPKDIGDGKATISRFSGQPYTETMASVKAALADARAALESAYAAFAGGNAPSALRLGTLFVAGTRQTDTVTGT
jgi:hypothetical protein